MSLTYHIHFHWLIFSLTFVILKFLLNLYCITEDHLSRHLYCNTDLGIATLELILVLLFFHCWHDCCISVTCYNYVSMCCLLFIASLNVLWCMWCFVLYIARALLWVCSLDLLHTCVRLFLANVTTAYRVPPRGLHVRARDSLRVRASVVRMRSSRNLMGVSRLLAGADGRQNELN